MTKADEKPPMEEYYIVVDKGTRWHFLCRKCDDGWSVPKDRLNAGNRLFLLNHARSHA